ncbi:unnamed protein product [Cunninghamella blakesleeana]
MMRLSKSWCVLLFYVLISFIQQVKSQTIDNPAFLEQIGTYSNVNQIQPDYNTNTFTVAQSQIFQTVFNCSTINFTVRSSRPIFDFSYACNNQTNITDLQTWNLDGLNKYVSINNLQKIALVQRGGGCTWMEKVLNTERLSTIYNLSITQLIIYDNQTYPNVNTNYYGSFTTGKTGVPQYSSPLPTITNISYMADNDIFANNDNVMTLNNNGNMPDQIYFVPNNFGMNLIQIIHGNNKYNTSMPNNYLFLQTLLTEVNWSPGTSIQNYITWIIALGAIFFLAAFGLFLFFRWWKMKQRSEDREYNIALEEHHLRMLNLRKVNPLPVNIVNSYPIQNYNPEMIKNSSCAICLEDYEENQPDIRLLPCGHGFCVLCIDPWLTQKSTLCPICKYNCLPSELQDEKENENNNNNNEQLPSSSTSSSSSPDTTTPPTTTTITETMDIADMNIQSSSSSAIVKENGANITTSTVIITDDSEKKEKINERSDIKSTTSPSQENVTELEKETAQHSKRISHGSNLSFISPDQLPLPDSQPSSTSSSPRHSIEEKKNDKKNKDDENER